MTVSRVAIRVLPVVAGVLAVALGGVVVAIRSTEHRGAMSHAPESALTSDEMAAIAADVRIAPFTGVDHRGAPIDASVFRGQWTVLSFGFTNCTLACPMLHGEIFRSSEKLASRGVKYLTISVDPEHDTVEQMAGYMKPWGVQNDAWTFARVDREMVRALLAGLQMPDVSEDPTQSVALPGGGTMANIQHPTRFFVVGPDATVRGLWRGSDPDDVDAMVRWILQRVF